MRIMGKTRGAQSDERQEPYSGACRSRTPWKNAFFLGERPADRKAWIDHRLEELTEIFTISVGGFSALDNHLRLNLEDIDTTPPQPIAIP
jgi:hypothetical protein